MTLVTDLTSAGSTRAVLKPELIRARAELMARARAFLSGRGLLEVDVPLLVSGAPLDDHIDLFEVALADETSERAHSSAQIRYLHSSPEYGMKRLLAAGCSDLFQISHVFRKGELGSRHNPEFLMAEWYRVGWSLQELIEETVQFFRLFLGDLPVRQDGYWDLLKEACGHELEGASQQQCLAIATERGLLLSDEASQMDVRSLTQLLFATLVEPKLGEGGMQVVCDWPIDQAALSRIVSKNGRRVAQRFEIYVRGLELCNGYDELSDPEEQRRRFAASNALRIERGLHPYTCDERLLHALHQLPSCAGVAVGLDRLFQLALGLDTLAQVLPWSWEQS